MKMYLCAAAGVLLAAFLLSVSVRAQNLEPGTWESLMLSPGGEYAEAQFEVKREGSTARAFMKWRSGAVEVSDLRLDDGILTFSWNPNFYMACRLERQPNRQFKGACLDDRKNVGPAVLSPPGVDLAPADLDIAKAFEVWQIDREAYMDERYPQPKTNVVHFEEPEPIPMRRVEVYGRKVNVSEVGEGDVTVVFESGVGDDHTLWQSVQNAVGELTKALSYDRPGLGASEATPSVRSPQQMAENLRATLESAGHRPPYVLVGHGAAAFTLRAFMASYPNEVVGIVLLDPAHEGEDDAWRKIDGESWNEYLTRKRSFLSAVSETAAREFDAYAEALATWDGQDIPANFDVPIVILSSSRVSDAPSWVGETREGIAARQELQRALAAELGAEFISTDESVSYIHLDEPELVVDEIRDILESINNGR